MNKVIYSSDGSGKNLAKNKTTKPVFAEINPSEHTLKISLEKKGRGGKTVTVIHDLPNNPAYFKKLHKELKNLCATGGAIKEDSLEIQGDFREKIKIFLTQKGFKTYHK